MASLDATETASSTCRSDFAEIEPTEINLQSSAVAEKSSTGLSGNETDSVNELVRSLFEDMLMHLCFDYFFYRARGGCNAMKMRDLRRNRPTCSHVNSANLL